jgi:alcohol dehydrogenase
MKAIYFREHGDISKLRYGDVPDPVVMPEWVKIRVRAASLNWLDIATRRGLPGIKTQLPGITGGDCAGDIVEIGASVSGWTIGQRVLPHPDFTDVANSIFEMLGETRQGALAEYCVVRASQLCEIPDEVSYDDAACLPIAYGTAYRMLITNGRVTSGEKVLILGASGGVGTACVLLCKMLGAHVIAAAGSAAKCQRLQELGAQETIDYSQVDFAQYIRKTTGSLFRGGGCDVVVNFTGGDTWAKSLKCVKQRGRLLTCGATAGYDPPTDLRYIWTSEMTIVGSNGWTMDDQKKLLDLARTRRLLPVIDRVVPLSEAIAAIGELENRQVTGKIVVQP